jgi:hypothetical protein
LGCSHTIGIVGGLDFEELRLREENTKLIIQPVK